jgi:hypothetical protein
VRAPALNQHRDVIRGVEVRTRDDLAVIQDLPKGRNQLGHGFPVTPAFDALSYFTLSWRVGAHQEVSSYVHDVTPLEFKEADTSNADVVVTRLYAYRATYAADSSDAPDGRTHVTLAPFQFVVNKATPETFYFQDLYVDNASGLPATITFGGNGKLFTLDYGKIEGHWLLKHVHYEEVLVGPLRIGRLHVIADVDYDNFTFPETAPDPRLA